eukprot:1989226-Alexandrium_andersonii.AAC.1
MLPVHRLVIESALGLAPGLPGIPAPPRPDRRREQPPQVPPPSPRSWRADSGLWCPFPRRRWFFASLPPS